MTKKISIKDYLNLLGISKLKDKQKLIINSFLRKKDTIGILPTGYGKSICYILPYLMKDKSVIVISPLISLMEDQNNKLLEKGIKTIMFNSSHEHIMNSIEGQTKYSNILKNNDKYLIYFSPESFIANRFMIKNFIQFNSISLIAIDECHCVSTWSDFRNDYNELNLIKTWINEYKKKIPILGLTATATTKTLNDITNKLNLNNPVIIKESIFRDNLIINIKEKVSLTSDIKKIKNFIIDTEKETKGIIYCKTRKETESIKKKLTDLGISCNYYHAGLSNKDRQKVQNNFKNGKIKIIIATIAFGMGIDIRDIHLIIHYGISKNIESYYQEIGRGGRNGKTVKCYILWSNKDFSTNRYFISKIEDETFKQSEMNKIIEVEKFIKSNDCRMKFICNYFDDYSLTKCNKCDNCIETITDISNNKIGSDSLKDIVIIRYFVLKTLFELGHGIGITSFYQILKGSNSKKLKDRMKQIESFGKLKHKKVNEIKEYIKSVLYNGYLEEVTGTNSWGSYYKVSKKGNVWYNKNYNNIINSLITIQKFKNKYVSFKKKNIKNKKINNLIYTNILEWRDKEARKSNLPYYCILNNKTIELISKELPKDEDELLEINGIGIHKLKKYGKDILSLVKN